MVLEIIFSCNNPSLYSVHDSGDNKAEIKIKFCDHLTIKYVYLEKMVQISFSKYRVSSETVYTCSLFVNCASHASLTIKRSIYFFSWIKIDAENGITLKN